MTLAEIMAGLGASQAVGGARTGALLTQTAEGERRQLLDAQRRLEEQKKDRERKAKRREKRRGFGRLVGSTIGFLVGGPAGAAIGSGLGQAGAAATQRGGYKLGDVSSGLGEGMFFKGGRADISSAERDVNRYLDDANKGFLTNIATSAITDYFTAGQVEKVAPGIRGGGFKAFGQKGVSLGDMLKYDPKSTGLGAFGKKGFIPSAIYSPKTMATEGYLDFVRPDISQYNKNYLSVKGNPLTAISGSRISTSSSLDDILNMMRGG